MVQTKVFKSNQSQAVRLPKAVAFSDSVKEVVIVAIGNTRVIAPAEQSWNDWFEAPPASSDFMEERNQPDPQKREAIDA